MAANIEVKMLGDMLSGLDQFEKDIQEKVLLPGVAAMAKVVYDEAKLNASHHIKSGTLYNAIYRTYVKNKSSKIKVTYQIGWNKRKAPHGEWIEFGTSKARASPFIRPAFDHIQTAIQAGKERMVERMQEMKSET